MSILEKVRDFFYDEEDEEEVKKELKKIQKPKKEKVKEIKIIHEEKPEKQEISERELFKAERTFNFPVDIDEYVKKEETLVIKKEEEPKPVVKEEKTIKYERPTKIPSYTSTVQKPKEEEKKFKPTPVISPVYGILDKNYKKEDVLIDSTIEKKENKVTEYEEVRKRAYSKVYEDDENTKDIFYNLEETGNTKDDEEVKIVYNDVTFDDNEEDEEDKNITIGEKIEKYEKELEKEQTDNNEEDDSNILSETKEQDLFNLIDNMYNSDEEDDEEEE